MTKVKNYRQLFFDTETTGLKQDDRIVQIGVVEMIDRQITNNEYSQLINPERDIPEEAIKIHGITQDRVAEAPIFADIIDDLLDYINGDELIIHNARFDVGMMNNEFKRLNEQNDKSYKLFEEYATIVDSLSMAQRLYSNAYNSLDALCDRFKINKEHRELHDALVDCHLLAKVYLCMTGGQKSLFSDSSPVAKIGLTKPLKDYSKLKLLQATVTDKELREHQSFMKKLTPS